MTGFWISYLVPALNSQWYSQFLVLLADMMNGERIKSIVDGMGWHISGDVDLPDNITFEVLPPYSPELNLVEQVWKSVRYNQRYFLGDIRVIKGCEREITNICDLSFSSFWMDDLRDNFHHQGFFNCVYYCPCKRNY